MIASQRLIGGLAVLVHGDRAEGLAFASPHAHRVLNRSSGQPARLSRTPKTILLPVTRSPTPKDDREHRCGDLSRYGC